MNDVGPLTAKQASALSSDTMNASPDYQKMLQEIESLIKKEAMSINGRRYIIFKKPNDKAYGEHLASHFEDVGFNVTRGRSGGDPDVSVMKIGW